MSQATKTYQFPSVGSHRKPPVTAGAGVVCFAVAVSRPVQLPDPSTVVSVAVTDAASSGNAVAVVRTHQVAEAPGDSVPDSVGGTTQLAVEAPEPTGVLAVQLEPLAAQATTRTLRAKYWSFVEEVGAAMVPVHESRVDPVFVPRTVAVRLGLCEVSSPARRSKPLSVTATVALATFALVEVDDAQSAWPAVAPSPTRRTVSPTRSAACARPQGRRVRLTAAPACRRWRR